MRDLAAEKRVEKQKRVPGQTMRKSDWRWKFKPEAQEWPTATT